MVEAGTGIEMIKFSLRSSGSQPQENSKVRIIKAGEIVRTKILKKTYTEIKVCGIVIKDEMISCQLRRKNTDWGEYSKEE